MCRAAKRRSKGAVSLDRGEQCGRLWVPSETGGRPVAVAACVSERRAVRLIYAGWILQDGLFGWSGPQV